ncbi:uncharacterized protein TNCV_315171 [Trichonephila clavipes]|nr:uncharacterized protein TNCV_315171 [Trichonephila clavipes]
MITNFFIPELNNHDVQELWFQQDGATCHTARATIDLLKDTFGDRLISRFGPVNWPPRSCDLTPLDYFLWGYVKSLVYADKPQTLDHLEDNIRRVIANIQPQMLEKVIENWTSRLDYIRASHGSLLPEIIFKIYTFVTSFYPFLPSAREERFWFAAHPIAHGCLNFLAFWIRHYQPENKRRSIKYRHLCSSSVKNFKTLKSTAKVILTIFWDTSGLLYMEFLTKEFTVSPDWYCVSLRSLKQHNLKIGPERNVFLLHHDSRRPLCRAQTQDVTGRLKFTVAPQPSYSPDLVPSDFSCY